MRLRGVDADGSVVSSSRRPSAEALARGGRRPPPRLQPKDFDINRIMSGAIATARPSAPRRPRRPARQTRSVLTSAGAPARVSVDGGYERHAIRVRLRATPDTAADRRPPAGIRKIAAWTGSPNPIDRDDPMRSGRLKVQAHTRPPARA